MMTTATAASTQYSQCIRVSEQVGRTPAAVRCPRRRSEGVESESGSVSYALSGPPIGSPRTAPAMPASARDCKTEP